jgi:hypothetical protein
MAYKVIDIYRDLPRTNCGDCGRGSCFSFATAVYLEAFPLESCPHLDPDRNRTMQERLDRGREEGEGRKPASSEQALEALRTSVAAADLATQAARCGGTLAGDGARVALRFLEDSYWASQDDVVADAGGEPTIWVKIFLLIYLTRASGRDPAGEWVAYRELPNTVSKSRSFEACAARIAGQFEGDLEGLGRAAARLGGSPLRFGSADRCYRFQVLPKVALLLLFWDREEEFPARVSLLLDSLVLDYLDQEAIVFLVEAFASRLLGGDLSEVVA